jgi:hypothetical protein
MPEDLRALLVEAARHLRTLPERSELADVRLAERLEAAAAAHEGSASDEEHLRAVVAMHRKELLAFGQYAAIVHPEDLPPDYRPGMKLMERPDGVREEWRVWWANGHRAVTTDLDGYLAWSRRIGNEVVSTETRIPAGPWVDVPTEETPDAVD